MWVRQKIGRTAGAIIEMPYDAAQSALASNTVAAVTDEELQQAGFPSQADSIYVPPEQLLADYRIEPSKTGQGFDIFDAGGVQINADPLHNMAAARDVAHTHARAARGLPNDDPVGKHSKTRHAGQGGHPQSGDGAADYDGMTIADLEKTAAVRGVDLTGAQTKADRIALLVRADKVQAAIAAQDYEVLTKAELEHLAGDRKVDVADAKTKADIVAALKK